MDEFVQNLARTLKASGVINTIIFRINEEGYKQFVDESGYTLSWFVEPAEFTFPETLSHGTITLPSLVITITDDEGETAGFRIPYTSALQFLTDIRMELEDAYRMMIQDVPDSYRNARAIVKSHESLKSKKASKKVAYEDREVV